VMMNAVKCMQWYSACSMHKVHRDYKNAEHRRDWCCYSLGVNYAGRRLKFRGEKALKKRRIERHI
jgi:hypothetical protein